jgi:ABC-type transport system involved in multi-copper enzyme maturation permease subunit
MLGRVYFLFGGPILSREVLRATRGRLPSLLRYAFIALLCFEIHLFADERTPVGSPHASGSWYRPTTRTSFPYMGFPPPSRRELLEIRRQEAVAAAADAGRYISFLLYQHLVLLLILTPVLTAGAIVYEKERDTLQALFGTELRSREIVVGKLLGRLIALGLTTAAVLPPLAFATALATIPVWRVVLALVQSAVLAYALASACLLASLWTRRPTDAVIGCYATMIVTFLLGGIALSGLVALGLPGLVEELNPLEHLKRLLDATGTFRPVEFLCHLAFWFAAGTLCLAVAALRVRPVSAHQAEKRAPRWLWAFRPPIGNNPVRWREQYVLGLAPIGVLRVIPRWMGRLGVLSFAVILAGDSLGHVVGRHVFRLFLTGQFAALWAVLRHPLKNRLSEDLNLMGGALLLLASATVCLRCAGCIAEEKRRKTWEDLILTPLTLGEILGSKYSGIVRAAVLPVLLYSLPMFALSALGGWAGVFQAGVWVVATGGLLSLTGAFGILFAEVPERSLADAQVGDPAGGIHRPGPPPPAAIRAK